MNDKALLEINLLQYNQFFKGFLERASSLVSGFSIINKSPFDQPLEVVQELRDSFKNHRVIPHISIKQNYQKSASQTLHILHNKLVDYQQIGLKEIFIVSGMPKRSLDSLNFLQQLSASIPFKIAVAYNPFFADSNAQELENQRLEAKLNLDCVHTVYLQLGQDIDIYNQSIAYLRSLKPDLQIIVAVLNPRATRVISSFSLRPWNGVFYSDKYLADTSYRLGYTRDLIRNCNALGVTTLLEFYHKLDDIVEALDY